MTVGHVPSSERDRLAAVHRYDVLDSPPDGAFDRITGLAARLLRTPIAIVSIVDEDRIWFKSHHGLAVDQIDRDPGLCASAILQDGPWVLDDASLDPRSLANPLVAGAAGFRYYAGIPLATHDGHNLGTLCVIDYEPRETSTDDLATLSDLASLVVDELELRLSARRTVDLEAELRRGAESVASVLQESLLPPRLPVVHGLELAARYHVADHDQVGGDFYDAIPSASGCELVVGDAVGKGVTAAAMTGAARWALRTAACASWTPSAALRALNEVMVTAHENPECFMTVAVASVRPDADGAAVTIALGGHPNPLLLRAGGEVEPIGRHGPIVGWRADSAYVDTTVRLGPGDVVVLFTDGLLDAVAGRGEVDDGPVRRLLRPLAGCSADQVACALDGALGDDISDDAAFLVVRSA